MSAQPSLQDVWAIGDTYDRYMGRWSRLIARDFIRDLALPPGSAWLDIGCGTGVLTQAVLEFADPSHVIGVDPSEGFLHHARRNAADARASFRVGDAQSLPVADDVVDAAVSGLVLNFVPDQAKALREMQRVTRPGGTVAFYVWDYAGEMQLIRRFWKPLLRSILPPAHSMKRGGSRTAIPVRSPTCWLTRACATSMLMSSTPRQFLRTLRIIGRHFSAAKVRRQPIAPPCPRSSA